MSDIRDSSSALSRWRVATGNRRATAAKGSYADQQRLTTDLLLLVGQLPTIERQVQEQGLPQRAAKDTSIRDRILRLSQDDVQQAAELVSRGDCLGALAYVFGTARKRLEMQESFQGLEIAS